MGSEQSSDASNDQKLSQTEESRPATSSQDAGTQNVLSSFMKPGIYMPRPVLIPLFVYVLQPTIFAQNSTQNTSLSRAPSGIRDELNCITCKTLFGLQIFQCNQGHSSCKSCKEEGRCCGICGNNITTMRNYAVETYLAEQKVQCPYTNNGCQLFIKMLDMDIHIKECSFKELQCPSGCFWKGHLDQLSSHFDTMHPQQRTVKLDSEMDLPDISDNSQNTYLMLIDNSIFLFHVKVLVPDRKIYMTVQLIGIKSSASKWVYEVHIYNKNQPGRKFTFTDSCTSYIEPVSDIFSEDHCFVLPHVFSPGFENNGALIYKMFIKKIGDSRPRSDSYENYGGRGK